jgi:hypothetical protein
MHSYYHLVPLVLNYCSVGYLSDSIDHSHYSCISSVDQETLGYTHGCGVRVYYLQ